MTESAPTLAERLTALRERLMRVELFEGHFYVPVHLMQDVENAINDALRSLSQSPQVPDRDRDWILAMGHALGLDSGFKVPIVPEVAPFKELFAAIRERAQSQDQSDASGNARLSEPPMVEHAASDPLRGENAGNGPNADRCPDPLAARTERSDTVEAGETSVTGRREGQSSASSGDPSSQTRAEAFVRETFVILHNEASETTISEVARKVAAAIAPASGDPSTSAGIVREIDAYIRKRKLEECAKLRPDSAAALMLRARDEILEQAKSIAELRKHCTAWEAKWKQDQERLAAQSAVLAEDAYLFRQLLHWDMFAGPNKVADADYWTRLIEASLDAIRALDAGRGE